MAARGTSIDGDYEFDALPPGRYGLAIVDEVDERMLRDPDAIAKLQPIASVTLTAGQTTLRNLREK